MTTTDDSFEARFRAAVAAIDAGDVAGLDRLLARHPELVRDRLVEPGAWLRDQVGGALEGFFSRPYLLWFVAEDPVRNGRLPANIAEVARSIVEAARQHGADSLQEQLDHAMRLVCWSWIARNCAVQNALIDVLADAGARLDGNTDNALVNGHVAAAERLLERGAPLTLGTAVCLGRWDDVPGLAGTATAGDKQFALVLAALNGHADGVRRMLDLGAALNQPSEALYSHATPLHHAVSSGLLETVRILASAGADLAAKDSAWEGTPLGWAEHYRAEKTEPADVERYDQIVRYLRQAGG